MSAIAAEFNTLTTSTLPESLKNLAENQKTIDQIATYCRNLTKKKEYDDVYKQTQTYSCQALMNAAYHVHTIATHLTRLLQLQSDELERLELTVKTVSSVRNLFHSYSNSFRTTFYVARHQFIPIFGSSTFSSTVQLRPVFVSSLKFFRFHPVLNVFKFFLNAICDYFRECKAAETSPVSALSSQPTVFDLTSALRRPTLYLVCVS
jgi:hypothetical protein